MAIREEEGRRACEVASRGGGVGGGSREGPQTYIQNYRAVFSVQSYPSCTSGKPALHFQGCLLPLDSSTAVQL